MTSSTSNSLMHFSMAMAPSAFWLVPGFPDAILVGKGCGANDGNGHFRCRRAAWAGSSRRRGAAGPDEFLKFR